MTEISTCRHRLSVGNFIITALSDGAVAATPRVVADRSPDDVRRLFAACGLPPEPTVSVNAFAIQHAGRTVLIDTGAGDKLAATLGRLPQSLAEAGLRADAIDAVLLTHMHPDHSNGLTDPSGEAAFPNAELVMHEDEYAHWLDDARMAQVSARSRRDNFEAARREMAPYRDRIRLFRQGQVMPGIYAHPLPGHTPGHTGYIVGADKKALLIWGDIVHLPDIQVEQPDIAVVLDTDKTAAIATRKRALDMAACEDFIIAGMHLHAPGFARVEREGNGFRLQGIAAKQASGAASAVAVCTPP